MDDYGNKEIWDIQYLKGLWNILKSPLEEERFEAVEYFIYKYNNHGSILELGCGEGLLQNRLNKDSYSKFLGIDISKIAIERAKRLETFKTTYQCNNMEYFEPNEVFDII